MGKVTKWILAVVFALMFGAGGVTVTVAAEEEGIDRHGMENDMPLPTEPERIEAGKERYGARCSYCHTPLGRGGSSSVCLACQKYKWGSKSSAIYGTIAAGRPNTKMGAFATSLTQDEILNIIAYIRTLQEKKIQDDLAAAKQ